MLDCVHKKKTQLGGEGKVEKWGPGFNDSSHLISRKPRGGRRRGEKMRGGVAKKGQ